MGEKNFAADQRYQSNHQAYNDQWNLWIRNVQLTDAGVYECQVSSRKETLRQNVTLHVTSEYL